SGRAYTTPPGLPGSYNVIGTNCTRRPVQRFGRNSAQMPKLRGCNCTTSSVGFQAHCATLLQPSYTRFDVAWLEHSPTDQRATEGHAVGILQIATHRQATCRTRHRHPQRSQEAMQI